MSVLNNKMHQSQTSPAARIFSYFLIIIYQWPTQFCYKINPVIYAHSCGLISHSLEHTALEKPLKADLRSMVLICLRLQSTLSLSSDISLSRGITSIAGRSLS